MTVPAPTPSLHQPIAMETRVRFPKNLSAPPPPDSEYHYGTVVGVSSMYMSFNYIVLLDEPIDTPEGAVRAVSVSGVELGSEDGTHNWRKKVVTYIEEIV